MNNKSAFFTSLVPLASVALISHAPLHDSYKESLIARQLNRDKIDHYGTSRHEQIFAKNPAIAEPMILTAQDMLLKFRTGGLPISAIAEMMGVERKTIYAWIDGSAVKSSNEDRISAVYSLLSENRTASYRSLYRYMNKNINGVTLGQLLKNQVLDDNLIKVTLAQLWPIAEKTERQLALSANNESTENGLLDDSEAFAS